MSAKTTSGANPRASPHDVKVATAATNVESTSRGLRFNLSERMPKVHWPSTCAKLINASSKAPCLELSPIDEAYEGRNNDGKKNPRPCAAFAMQ